MDLGEALISRLSAAAAVTAIVPAARIHWVRREQGGPLPALVLHQVGGAYDHLLDGESEIIETRVQCDCLAATHLTATALAKAVGDTLIEPATVGGMDFWASDRERPIDLGEDTPQGFVHRTSVDIILRHSTGS